MQNTYTQNITIRYSECDRFGKLKLRPLFDYAQEAAGNHAAVLGVATQVLQQRNLTWVLSRIKYSITSYPGIEEKISILTYPCSFDKMFARREFRFYREDGTEFARATSLWLIVNMETKRIVIPDDELKTMLPDNSDLSVAFTDIGKIIIKDGELPISDHYDIRENMIDINNHLNNAECGIFLQNFLGIGVYPSEIQINYTLSVPPQSALDIAGKVEDNSYLFTALLDGHQAIQMTGKIGSF